MTDHPRPAFLYRFVRTGAQVVLRVGYRFEVVGQENVPRTGRVIIASNHRSLADPPIVGAAVPREVHFMAKKELFSFGPFGWFISNLNAHPLNRKSGTAGVKQIQDLLRRECAVIMFPEGKRMKTDEIGTAKPGVGLLSISTQSPIVPVYVHNSGHMGQLKRISVRFGKPIEPGTQNDYQKLANSVLSAIKSLKKINPTNLYRSALYF